jgi:hypothetical protein
MVPFFMPIVEHDTKKVTEQYRLLFLSLNLKG